LRSGIPYGHFTVDVFHRKYDPAGILHGCFAAMGSDKARVLKDAKCLADSYRREIPRGDIYEEAQIPF
jgi:hypothetical protein